MRYERTDSFKADYRRLSDHDRQRFKDAVRAFNDGCERFIAIRDASAWPASLRVKAVQWAPGIWEMTWSFAGPDGRATWELMAIDDDQGRQPPVRWRRVGDHRVLRDP